MNSFKKILIGLCFVAVGQCFLGGHQAEAASAPTITSISPSSVKIGDTVSIIGSGFTDAFTTAGNTVYFNNCAAGISGCYSYFVQNISSSNGTSISFVLPATMKHSATGSLDDVADYNTPIGNLKVSIFNLSGSSNSFDLTVAGIATKPVVASAFPTSGTVDSNITVFASGLTAANNTVTLKEVIEGGTPSAHNFSNLSSSDGKTLVFTITNSANNLRAGTHSLYVTNANGTSNAIGFIVADVPVIPNIASIVSYPTPSSVKIGDNINIHGSGFTTTDNTVYFNNCATGISGCYSYFLQNLGSSSGTDISFVLPTTMKHSATGVEAAITDATTPTGSLRVSVTNVNGYSNSFNLTVTSGTVTTLAITSVSPSSVKSGDAITILGSGFTTTTYNQVKILSNSCLGMMGCYASIMVSALSSNGTTISFNIPSSIASYPDGTTKTIIDTPTGSFKFFVLSGDGQTSNSVDLTITSSSVTAPVITQISPVSGGVGDTITVYGTGFTSDNNTVTLKETVTGIVHDFSGLSPVTTCSTNTGSSGCTALVSTITNPFNNLRAGTHSLYVTNANGQNSNVLSFIVASAPSVPVITSISPSSANVGDTITITGNSFAKTNTVYFNNCATGISGCYSYFLQNLGSSSGTDISFVLPTTMKHSATGVEAAITDATTPTGSLRVSVTNVNGYSNSVDLMICPQGWTLYGSRCVSLIPPPVFPTTLIKIPENQNIYLIANNQKILIPSWQAFVDAGLNSADIKIVSLSEFNSTQTISLLKSWDDERVYAIKGMQKLWIPSAAAFVGLGYKWENIVTLPSVQANIYGTISLAKVADSNKVYLLGVGQRQWITTVEKFIALGYNWNDIAVVSNQELNTYSLGGDIK